MRQTSQDVPAAVAMVALAAPNGFPPDIMAQHLRRTSGSNALCFAQAMHEGAGWANEVWDSYWATVVRLVQH